MKRRVYIETAVVSYFPARLGREVIVASRREATLDLQPGLTDKRKTYIPAIVHEEAG